MSKSIQSKSVNHNLAQLALKLAFFVIFHFLFFSDLKNTNTYRWYIIATKKYQNTYGQLYHVQNSCVFLIQSLLPNRDKKSKNFEVTFPIIQSFRLSERPKIGKISNYSDFQTSFSEKSYQLGAYQLGSNYCI